MKKTLINNNWQYTLWRNWWDKQTPQTIDLPHDWSISQKRHPENPAKADGAFYPGATLIYTKSLDIPENLVGQKVIIEFEGAYMNALVKINNQLVAKNNYGYSSFYADITPYVNYGGENKLKVIVNNSAQPNSRWYSGTGIYRNVWLLTSEKCSIKPWGVYITTPQADEKESIVKVETQFSYAEEEYKDCILHTSIIDDKNKVIKSVESNIAIGKNAPNICQQILSVSNCNLWSAESPNLYVLKSELFSKSKLLDENMTTFGIRSISASSSSGLRVNGNQIKLKGGCIHHDNGILGAASFDRAEERKVELLKSSGFNAVRCAHNPPSPAFLDACDRIGLYVIDEAFDCWQEGKNPNDYHVYFESDWQKDIDAMVLRDRNHPSIIMWSSGNEIPERGGMSEGYEWSKKLANYIKSLDDTRLITNALNNISLDITLNHLETNLLKEDSDFDVFAEYTAEYAAPLDVVGYNYLGYRCSKDKEKFPERIICGLESFPIKAYEYWKAVVDNKNVIGDFVWTAIDYLGEAGLGHVWRNNETSFLGNYPWHHANCGDMDICGFKRPQSYFRDALWRNSDKPYIAVEHPKFFGKSKEISAWGWEEVSSRWDFEGFEGEKTHVEVYCSLDEVELLLNDKVVEKKKCGEKNEYKAVFEIPYTPGTLTAVGYKAGVKTSVYEIKTPQKVSRLRLTPDRSVLNQGSVDLSYITIEAVDDSGTVVAGFDKDVSLSANGAGRVIALGSGNPMSELIYTGCTHKPYEGRLMGVVKSNGNKGTIVVTAECEGLSCVQIELSIK